MDTGGEGGRRLAQLAAASGVAYVVLELTGLGLRMASQEQILTLSSTEDEVARAFADPVATTLWVGMYLEVLAYLCLGVFTTLLAWRLGRANPHAGWLAATALGAAAVAASLVFGSLAAFGTAFNLSGPGVDLGVAGALSQLGSALYTASWAPTALMLGCFSALVLAAPAWPRWIGWLGAGPAAALLAGLAFRSSELSEFPGFLVVLWLLAVAVRLLRAERRAAPSDRAPEPARA